MRNQRELEYVLCRENQWWLSRILSSPCHWFNWIGWTWRSLIRVIGAVNYKLSAFDLIWGLQNSYFKDSISYKFNEICIFMTQNRCLLMRWIEIENRKNFGHIPLNSPLISCWELAKESWQYVCLLLIGVSLDISPHWRKMKVMCFTVIKRHGTRKLADLGWESFCEEDGLGCF